MFQIVKVISNFVENGYRYIKVNRLGLFDVQTAKQISPFGFDSSPVKYSDVNRQLTAIYMQTSKKGKPVIVGYYNKSLVAGIGESRIFSVDETGEVKTFVWCKNDGQLLLGGDADNAVRFSKLKAGFDQLVTDHNKLVTAFNEHVHAGNGVPPTAVPGSIPADPSSASVDDSKIDEIKTL